jgi:hypothetical protein
MAPKDNPRADAGKSRTRPTLSVDIPHGPARLQRRPTRHGEGAGPHPIDLERAFIFQNASRFSTDKDRLTKILDSSRELPSCRVH